MVLRTGSWEIGATAMGISRVVCAARAALLALPLLAGCGLANTSPASSYSGKVAHVKLALDWLPNTNHTGIYVAQQKGFYQDNGIQLELLPYASAEAPEQLVSTGQADFGISFTEGVTAARAVGQPLVSIAAIFQHNTSALVTLKSSGLDSVARLTGKRYAGFGAPYEAPIIQQMLNCGGAGTTSFENVTTDIDPIAALKSGQFDFAWIFMGVEGIQAQDAGTQLNVFSLLDYCIPDYYSPVIVTSERFITQQPGVIRRFLSATAQGYTYAAQHPREAADLLRAGAQQASDLLEDARFVH